ncbi:hypothetical protein JW879_02780 [candidate division WOR-3 bacterium]|nr:hypothetical protein [candidate division WOR-3 bacterium]
MTFFEDVVFKNLKKYGKLNYYEKYKGPEIDFILNGKIAFEAKIKPDTQDLKKLKRTAEKLNLKEHFLIMKDYAEVPNSILAQDL